MCNQLAEEGVAVRITGEVHLPTVAAEEGVGWKQQDIAKKPVSV